MKTNEIEVGKAYTNNKGGVRLVIAEGPERVAFDWVDCVRYRVIKKKRGPYLIGSEHDCTRNSFAAWAREIVTV